jgi:hypothetical protein
MPIIAPRGSRGRWRSMVWRPKSVLRTFATDAAAGSQGAEGRRACPDRLQQAGTNRIVDMTEATSFIRGCSSCCGR